MHVAFLTNEYPHRISGGLGTSIQTLARALVKAGHRATVVGCGERAEFDDQGVQVQFFAETPFPKAGWILNRMALQKHLNHLVRHDSVDIVEAYDWCGLSAGLRLDCPIVIRCHGSATYFGDLLGEAVRPSVRLAEWLALRGADSVGAVSQFAAAGTRRLFKLATDVGVIANGIEPTRFSPAPLDEVEPDTVLYFGTLVRKKGVLDVCRVFSALVDVHPSARLRLVGRDASDRQSGNASTWDLCRVQLSAAARERVEYLGPRPYDEMHQYVRSATVCVFPSYAEAMPLAWLEAMACGKAVIVYDIGWAPEVIEHNVSGILVPPGNTAAFVQQLRLLLSDSPRRERLGAEARRRVERLFAADLNAQRSLAWYERVVKIH